MDASSLYSGLVSAGYPVAYREFREKKTPPFIIYYFDESQDFYADNSNYQERGAWVIELYTKTKNVTAEAAVEAQLATLGLPWSKQEVPVESEGMLMMFYTVQLIPVS